MLYDVILCYTVYIKLIINLNRRFTMFHLNHFKGGDLENNGNLVEFDKIEDAQSKVTEWESTSAMTDSEKTSDWSVEDQNHNHVTNCD